MAKYRYSHRKSGGAGTKQLTEGQMLAAFKYGIADWHTVQAYLEYLGYSSGDALILLETENKGRPLDPQPSPFPSVSAAMAFLAGLGYTFTPPPDPQIAAAEGMVFAAGYGINPPPAFPVPPQLPGPFPIPGTGSPPPPPPVQPPPPPQPTGP